ncbi:MAG TPA: serpin family protein, partial [Gemmatimonadaceae bacterium]
MMIRLSKSVIVTGSLMAMLASTNCAHADRASIDAAALGQIRPDSNRALPLSAFGSRLFASLVARGGRDSNTVVSPLSAGLALSLVRMGALGETATELDRALGLTALDRAAIERRGAAMLADLSGREDVELETANAVWVDTTAVLTDAFRASVSQWRSTAATLPLASEGAANAINAWADSVTHKKINKVLGEKLPDLTRLFIANAVYFKGKWLTEFQKSATTPGDFMLASGQRISVPRMDARMTVGYRRTPQFQIVRLPYRTGKTAMYVLLPDSGVTFDTLVARIRGGDW